MDKVGVVKIVNECFIEYVDTRGEVVLLNMRLCSVLQRYTKNKSVTMCFQGKDLTIRCTTNEHMNSVYESIRTAMLKL
jgi:hypothetical protein